MSFIDDENERRSKAYLDNIEDMMIRYGWAIVGVMPTLDDPDPTTFAYTVGLTKYSHPEVITFGLPVEVAQQMLNDVAAFVREGEKLRHGQVDERLAIGYPAMYLQVEPEVAASYVTIANRFFGADARVPVFQLVFPDKEKRWPWEDGCALSHVPLLGTLVVGA